MQKMPASVFGRPRGDATTDHARSPGVSPITGKVSEMEATLAPDAWVALRDAVRRHRRGIDQERMIADRIPLRVWQRDG